jgi:tetratricopeptide (TPR) repeat protein
MERSEKISYAETIFDPHVLIGICITLILIFLSLFKLKEKPEYAFGTLFLFIAFFPASGIIIPVAGIMYEHYMYAPIIGLSFTLSIFVNDIFQKYTHTQPHSFFSPLSHPITKPARSSLLCYNRFLLTLCVYILALALIVWVVALGIRTIARNTEWKDPITFYEQTLAHAPTSLHVWNNLGMAYADEKMNEKAIGAYSKAITLDPRNPIPYHNLGNIYEDEKNIEMAKKYWQTAISLNPQFIQPRLKLERYK